MLPFISIIIPARNEEKRLPHALNSIHRAANRLNKPIEIIVVINRCTDSTESIACEAGCVIVHDESKNLSMIRNAGAKAARGELIVTIDADSLMTENMLTEICSVMESSRFVGGAVLIYPERYSLGILTTMFSILIIALWYGISCGLFFCRREDFLAISGFDESVVSAEDLDFAKRLKAYGKRHGKKFKILTRAWITTSCRKFDSFGDWFFFRNPIQGIKLLLGKDQKIADRIWYDYKE